MTQVASRSLRLILHGDRAQRDDLRDAVRAVREEGHEVDVRVTWEEGDARRYALEARTEVDVVVAGGGDGTLREVAEGLSYGSGGGSRRAAMAVLPLGTGNDFATEAGVMADQPVEALRLAATGAPTSIDLGECEGLPFLNMATGGFGTEVTRDTPDALKNVLGRASYALTGLRQMTSLEPERGRVEGPDFSWGGRFLAIALGNGRTAGGGMRLCGEALVDDGLLDLIIVPEIEEGRLAVALRGLFGPSAEVIDEIGIRARLPWVELTTDRELQVNLDGEPTHGRRFRFALHPHTLRFVLPPNCPLLGRG